MTRAQRRSGIGTNVCAVWMEIAGLITAGSITTGVMQTSAHPVERQATEEIAPYEKAPVAGACWEFGDCHRYRDKG